MGTYAPLSEAEGKGQDFAGSVGAEFHVQGTPWLLVGYSHDATGMKWGAVDGAVSVKYRRDQYEHVQYLLTVSKLCDIWSAWENLWGDLGELSEIGREVCV